MNTGELITNSLRRSGMAVGDWTTRQYALDFLNEICQQYWELAKAKHRISVSEIVTIENVEEYALTKYCSGPSLIVKDSMRGTDPIRRIIYKPSHQFYREHPYELPTEDPYEYRNGQALGVAAQPTTSTQITIASSKTSVTTGTVAVAYGSKRVTFSASILSQNTLGEWLWVGTDAKRYQLTAYESATVGILAEPYEGATAGTATFALGDVQQKAVVMGYDTNAALVEEEVQLNGATSVTTSTTFQSLIKVTKSGKTSGYVSFTSGAGAVSHGTLDPGETDAVWNTIKLYPIPAKAETITYECYIKHPVLYRMTDSPLIPSQYHNLLGLELYIRLMTEHLGRDVHQDVLERRNILRSDFETYDNDTDNWTILQESNEDAPSYQGNNLPNNYPYAVD